MASLFRREQSKGLGIKSGLREGHFLREPQKEVGLSTAKPPLTCTLSSLDGRLYSSVWQGEPRLRPGLANAQALLCLALWHWGRSGSGQELLQRQSMCVCACVCVPGWGPKCHGGSSLLFTWVSLGGLACQQTISLAPVKLPE